MQELELLDKDNNPLTHAKYHRESVREAGERERRPLPLEIPEYLEQKMRAYLEQVSSSIYWTKFIGKLLFTIKALFFGFLCPFWDIFILEIITWAIDYILNQ